MDSIVKDIQEVVQNLVQKIQELTDRRDELMATIKGSEVKISSLEEVIQTLEKKSESYRERVADEDKIASKIADLSEQLSQNKADHKQILDIMNEELELLAKQKESLNVDIEKLNKVRAEALERYMPTIEDLNRKEASLKQKERDLGVIESRWKKLYADKGVGFKV